MAQTASLVHLGTLACALTLAGQAWAVVPSENLLPATTKGFVSTHDVEQASAKFDETTLGKWLADPLMKPFVDDLKEQVGGKLEKAGKRLGVTWEDLKGASGGEVSVALVQPDPKNKLSHATVLIVDITGKDQQAAALLVKVDANQKTLKAVRTTEKVGDVVITIHTRPLAVGEKVPEASLYFSHNDQLVFTDHLLVAKEIIGRLNGAAQDTLASIAAFKYTMDRNAKAAAGEQNQLRWFVEPFGYAEASRATQGGRKKRGADYLKILQTQGFNAVQGVGGYVFFATGKEEVLHRTYVYAPAVKRPEGSKVTDKYDLAMRMADFPNGAGLKPQAWALPDVASYLTFNWKMKPAFGFSETLVDAIAGDKGVFKEVLLSLKTDPNGPRIDIEKELVANLGERATLLSDVKLPVGLKSERLMTLVEVKNPDVVAIMLEKAFKADPAAKKRVFKGQIIWEIQQEQGIAASDELMIEGAGFVSKDDEGAAEEEEKPVLPNMAVTVFDGHLVVATHVDYIEDLVSHGGKGPNLATRKDYQDVDAALVRLGSGVDSFRYFVRTDESYRATYELLKQGKLPEAETLLARLLNGLFAPDDEGAIRKQEIDGKKLPDFELMSKYLGPGGGYVQSEDDGWWIVGCLLKK